MKREFLENIEGKESGENMSGYRDLAKTKLAHQSVDGSFDDSEWQKELDRRIAYAAQTRKTPEGIQKAIFKLQVEKQKIMEELQLKLKQLDHPDQYGPLKPPSNSRWVALDRTTGRYKVTGKRGGPITLGQMMTGGNWGMDFFPISEKPDHPSKPDLSVPRREQKLFYIQNAKRRIKDLLDQQILLEEANSKYTGDDAADTYRKMLETIDQGVDNESSGLLAERMVESLMTQMMYDLPGVFTITASDPELDVIKKVDFYVEVEARKRGVEVSGTLERKAIQFTIQRDPAALAKKRAQINQARRWLDKKREDLVLVQVSLDDVREIYRLWKKDKSVGGPEGVWPAEIKRRIFASIMEGLLPPGEIRHYLDQMFPSGTEAANTVPQKRAA